MDPSVTMEDDSIGFLEIYNQGGWNTKEKYTRSVVDAYSVLLGGDQNTQTYNQNGGIV